MTQNSLVLLVDDVPQNIQLLGNILKKEGYSFALTSSGIETTELLKNTTPDIILLDIMLPEMDGFQIVEAKAIGAVNAIKPLADGTWMGHNTDAVGFLNSIRPFLRSDHERALIIGNGGAAKAVRFELLELGVAVAHVTRQEVSWPSVRFEGLSPEAVGHHKLIVQCTPVGTYPDLDACVPFPWTGITPQHLVVDLVYNPAETQFLKNARAMGAEAMNGKDMLHAQADAAWRWWHA